MGHDPRYVWRSVDASDLIIVAGFGCVVAGVDLRYDHPLALIVFGVGLLLIGAVALWRNA